MGLVVTHGSTREATEMKIERKGEEMRWKSPIGGLEFKEEKEEQKKEKRKRK